LLLRPPRSPLSPYTTLFRSLYANHGRDLRMTVRYYGYSIMMYDLRPKARGRVGLKSNNPFAPPLIDPQYLTHRSDLERMIRGIRSEEHTSELQSRFDLVCRL